MLQERRRPRDPAKEAQERLRYQVLEWVLKEIGSDCEQEVSVFGLAEELDVPREAVFAAVEYLARKEYLEYRGAGPRVCITPKGLEFLLKQSRRRRSVRDRDE